MIDAHKPEAPARVEAGPRWRFGLMWVGARWLQTCALQAAELGLVDALELNTVARPQREIAIGDVDQLQRRAANEVPAAGPDLGVDASLPPRQPNAARLDARARRSEARHPTKRRRKIPQVGKAGTEADCVDRVDCFAVQTDHLSGTQPGLLGDALEVELELVTAGDAVQAGLGKLGRIGPARQVVFELLEVVRNDGVADLVEVEEDGNARIRLDDIDEPAGPLATDRGGEAERLALIGKVKENGLITQWLQGCPRHDHFRPLGAEAVFRGRVRHNQVAELGELAQRLEGPRLVARCPDVAGVAEQSLLEGAADRGGGALDRVRDVLLVAIDQIPQLADGWIAVARCWHAPCAEAGEVLDELAARRGTVPFLQAQRSQDRPLRPLGQVRYELTRRR